jgi:glycosyltransferase involved in cell wall biosynthesis
MRIVHAMLAPGKGGIEFAFVRWTQALLALGHEVTCVVGKDAAIAPHLPEGVSIRPLRHAFEADPLAIWRLRRWLAEEKPSVIITHGNRAGRLLRAAHRGRVPHLAVLHRPRFKGLPRYDGVACITRELMQQAEAHGVPAARLHHVPNFLAPETVLLPPRRGLSSHPVIGALGRFVPEKGMDLLVAAMAEPGMERFRLRIGGDGPERASLEASIHRLGVQDRVELVGWVEDTAAFYQQIDVLCVPSRRESFGLIILEAWAQGVPVVATDTSGPSELFASGTNGGLLCHPTPQSIAAALSVLLSSPGKATMFAHGGQSSLQPYRMENVLPNIQGLLESLTQTRGGDVSGH